MHPVENTVVLVDAQGARIGTSEKLAAHREGRLHLAVSVFIFDTRGRLLLQQRADGKYHSGGRWSNSSCSHPRPGERIATAAHRCLKEELGVDCRLRRVGAFTYQAAVGNDLVEHEYDVLFVGQFDGSPSPVAAEVSNWRWEPWTVARDQARAAPELFSAWFLPALDALVHAGAAAPVAV